MISAFPRDYVLFCGAVFDDLLDQSDRLASRESHAFHLPTKAGMSKSKYQFSNVTIRHEGGTLRAGVARSFATMDLPMDAYGVKCQELYWPETPSV